MSLRAITPVAFVLAVTVLLSGCNRERAIEPVNLADLNGTWRLVQPASSYGPTLILEKLTPHPLLPEVAWSFRANGKAAINGYSTLLSVPLNTTGQVSVSEVTSTFIGGSTEAMRFEQTYLANLRAVDRFELTTKNRLWLYYTGPQPGALVYEKAP